MSTLVKEINNNKTDSLKIRLLTQKGFQFLYLEYYSYLQDYNAQEISSTYYQGLKYNLNVSHFNPEALQYVKKEIDLSAKHIETRKKICQQKLLEYSTPEALALQESLCLYINSPNNANQQLEGLKSKLLKNLETNPEDILSEFNLAWMYFHIFEDYRAANMHFSRVADHSILDDIFFTQLALRYQALTYRFLDERKHGLSVLRRAASLDQTNNSYHSYEVAQQSVGVDNDKAMTYLKALIKHSPLFYLHIQSDPCFSDHPEVDQLLASFHTAKLESIKEMSFSKWKDCELMQQPLPQEFNQQKIFKDCYEEHLQLLTHQPYPLLCRVGSISDKIVRNLKNRTKKKLKTINQQFTQTIQVEQKKWKIINLLGMMLVYISVLLTLASIFLFIGSDLLGLTAKGGIINWQEFIPKVFASVLGTGMLGVLLLLFNSPKLKNLVKKRSMVSNVIG